MKPTETTHTMRMKRPGTDSALNACTPDQTIATAAPGQVRSARVARLRAAIEAGTYDVSSEVLAERLMEHMLASGRNGSPGRDL